MALKFTGSDSSGTEESEMNVFNNDNNEIYISISVPWAHNTFICLDRETAISLSKQLRKSISFLDKEGDNG